MTKVGIARKFRELVGWEMPTRKAARIMYEENKLTFKDVEDARYILRALEGKTGSNIKVSIDAPTEPRPNNPYNLPPSHEAFTLLS